MIYLPAIFKGVLNVVVCILFLFHRFFAPLLLLEGLLPLTIPLATKNLLIINSNLEIIKFLKKCLTKKMESSPYFHTNQGNMDVNKKKIIRKGCVS